MPKPRGEHTVTGAWIQWEDEAWGVLVAELARNKVTYKELSRRLEAMGIQESATQLNRKVNRKKFSAAFLLACMSALGIERIEVSATEESEE